MGFLASACENERVMSQLIDALDAGRQAASRRSWREAHALYSAVENGELAPEDLESFAEAAWWTGRLEQAIDLREQAYARFSAVDDKLGAARMALALSWNYEGRGAFAVSKGWFGRAERLLQQLPESVLHAHLTLSRGMLTLHAGDIDAALPDLEKAYALGSRFGDASVQALALVGKGYAFVHSGQVAEGLALLDEATAAAVSGALEPFATGLIYCCTIASCQDVGDYRRAAEWTEAANRWCDRLDVTGFPGACRVHRAEIMRLRGDWPKAEAQAVAACEELYDFDRFVTASGFYEIGEIRRRRGDFGAAEEAYAKADELGREPQPGRALLLLAQGKVDAALTAIRRALDQPDEPLTRMRGLPAYVQIALAAGDVPAARTAAEELERIVRAYEIGDRPAPAFDATLHVATGRIALADESWDSAARCLRRARDGWRQVGAPYETAEARLLLGIAYRRQGDEAGGTAEVEAALTTFEGLGARLDAERAKELLGRLETRRTFLFTDIVDSTRLLETLGNEKWKRLLARHDELLRERILDNGGEVIKQTGDGFFAAFGSPKAAIDAAVAIQRVLAGEIVAPDVRIGIHTGGAFQTEREAADYGGQGVHTAARIGAAAGALEILVSRETLDGVGTALRLSQPRAQELKGFSEPVEVVSVDWR
jgi:class 3 adenylate cyclase